MTQRVLLICLLFAVFCPAQLKAQYNIPQNKTWAMGFNTGLSFNTDSPTVITTGLASSNEGCASVCDSTGELLFYTNGTDVWTAAGVLMPNGTDINGSFNNTISTTQGALIVPDPADKNRYYLFSLTAVSNCSLYCNVVDMTLNNGAGDIDLAFSLKGTMLKNGLTEKMTAVAGCNHKIWIVVHSETLAQFEAYSVDNNGFNPTPVVSLSGGFPGDYYTQGVLKAAPGGNRLMICNFKSFNPAKGVEVYDFDFSTGTVSNAQIIDSIACYGGAFSPDGSKIYAQAVTSPGTVYQYDLNAAVPSASKANLGTSGQYTDMKLAPDGKIYFGAVAGSPGYNNYRYMGRINNPDLAGAACNFQDSVTDILFLNTAQNAGALAQGLPNEVVYALTGGDQHAVVLDTMVCALNEQSPFILHANGGYADYVWYDNSTDSLRTVTERGTYWVRYVSACGTFTDTFKITGEDLLPLTITSDNNILTASSGFDSYTWYKADTLISGAGTATLTIGSNGWYSVVAANKWGCSDSASMHISDYTDIDDIMELQNSLKIYPNPARTEIKVRAAANVLLTLVNIHGRVLASKIAGNKIDIQNLRDGLYLLRIEDRYGNLIRVEKIVKAP